MSPRVCIDAERLSEVRIKTADLKQIERVLGFMVKACALRTKPTCSLWEAVDESE